MAVREFTDSRGVDWRVWDVTPAHMHPITRGEDYMGNLQDGWLVFESGREKRRLEAPYPAEWTRFPIQELEELCRKASLVVRRRASSPSGERRAISAAEIEGEAIRGSGSQVTFASPGGREWTVRVHECLDKRGRPQKVLRFTADDIVVELEKWPDDWRTATMKDFAVMLLDASPPRRRPKGEGPQRRHDDRPVDRPVDRSDRQR
ncbi:MAG TPA: hypothetical protein VGG84_09660 [Gemmatimonadaceae bacterium]|jgi:hypothetical protein